MTLASRRTGGASAAAQSTSGRWSWWRSWCGLTLVAAVLASLADAILLQQRRAYFTGGFLASDVLTTTSEVAAFAVVSLVLDAAVWGAAVAMALWACSAAGLRRGAALLGALMLALFPFALDTLVQYQLLAYVGDAFDVGLMFDLAGRSASEVVAVAWPQITLGAGVAVAALLVMGAFAWRYRARPGMRRLEPMSFRSVAALCAALVIPGAIVSTAARTSSDALDNGLRRKPSGRVLGTLVNVASDVDRDGFGLLGRPPDPDLFDGRVRPYALEVPGNGFDENGVGGDLPPVGAYTEPPFGAVWQSRPDVVLIVLESFRADAVGASLNGRPVTPTLDRLAAEGIRVRDAYSHNGYTVQSRRHIFSGSTADLGRRATLLDDFNANGYQTAYFSAQDETFGGPDQGVGFERADVAYDARSDRDRRYSSFSTAGSLAVSHEVLRERVGAFLAARASAEPLFLYVNFHDTHFPYHHDDITPLVSRTVLTQSAIAPGSGGALREMYLNAAANVDGAIAALLHDVREALGREPGVIVLADHGESLFEEGFLGHGYALNDAQTRIPLIVSGLPLTVPAPFGQSDLRRIINDAFSAPPAASASPVVRASAGKSVFQYLGNIARPGQIAFVTSTGRITYDLRRRVSRFGEGSWKPDGRLSAEERHTVLDLIHTWERMLLARDQVEMTSEAGGGETWDSQ